MIILTCTHSSALHLTTESATARIIYHLVPADYWAAQLAGEPYRPADFAKAGFVHCSPDQETVQWVANTSFGDTPGDLLLLTIDARKVTAEIRWEAADERIFPHIYGPLDRGAIMQIEKLDQTAAGSMGR